MVPPNFNTYNNIMLTTNLLTNIVLLGWGNLIPTNTPAFDDYAFQEMFSRTTWMMTNWHLDIKAPITTNAVTSFHANAYPAGIGGTVIFDNRFIFSTEQGYFPRFADKPYESGNFLTDDAQKNDSVLEKWLSMTNLLTLEKAQKIAQSAIIAVHLPVHTAFLKTPSKAEQQLYERANGQVCPIPYYMFAVFVQCGSPKGFR